MKEENYYNLINNISTYYNGEKYFEISELGKNYIKVLTNSVYGQYAQKYWTNIPFETVSERRSKKIKRILDERN